MSAKKRGRKIKSRNKERRAAAVRLTAVCASMVAMHNVVLHTALAAKAFKKDDLSEACKELFMAGPDIIEVPAYHTGGKLTSGEEFGTPITINTGGERVLTRDQMVNLRYDLEKAQSRERPKHDRND